MFTGWEIIYSPSKPVALSHRRAGGLPVTPPVQPSTSSRPELEAHAAVSGPSKLSVRCTSAGEGQAHGPGGSWQRGVEMTAQPGTWWLARARAPGLPLFTLCCLCLCSASSTPVSLPPPPPAPQRALARALVASVPCGCQCARRVPAWAVRDPILLIPMEELPF